MKEWLALTGRAQCRSAAVRWGRQRRQHQALPGGCRPGWLQSVSGNARHRFDPGRVVVQAGDVVEITCPGVQEGLGKRFLADFFQRLQAAERRWSGQTTSNAGSVLACAS